MRRSKWWMCCGLIVLSLPTHAETVHLTAISQYLKGGSSTQRWETNFGDSAYSIFLVSGDVNGGFVNVSPPPDVATEIDIPLHDGNNEFVGLMGLFPDDSLDLAGRFGMSLYFDGAGGPGISAMTLINSGTDQPFSEDGDKVPTYPANDVLTNQGANTLSTTIGGKTITLTRYQFYEPTPTFSVDRVSPVSDVADGSDDFVVKFTLRVEDASATPLPSAALAGAALLPMLMLSRRSRPGQRLGRNASRVSP